MNGYVCFYAGRRIEIEAETSYDAWKLAVIDFNAPRSKRHMVSVVLAEKDGKEVVRNPGEL